MTTQRIDGPDIHIDYSHRPIKADMARHWKFGTDDDGNPVLICRESAATTSGRDVKVDIIPQLGPG